MFPQTKGVQNEVFIVSTSDGGEDGFVKMWSRNGMLRSILAQFATPVYCVAWDLTSSNVLYCNTDHCYIKSLKMQLPPLKWKAHDGIILSCDWNPTAGLIVTGGEDCKFKVWDVFGQILFNSSVHDFPITTIAWNIDGSLFAVGSHNILRLCDRSGWSHSLEKLNTGSVMSMSWSPDGTQLAVGTAAGIVFNAHITDKRLTYEEFELIQTKKTVIEVRDVSSEISRETLETKERISRISILYRHLIVVTSSYIYIYSSKNWNTPTMIEYADKTVNIIVQCEKVFLVSDSQTITVFNYEGRKLITINPPGQVMTPLDERKIDLSNDTLVVRNRADHKVLHFFDPTTGKQQGDGNLTHENDILWATFAGLSISYKNMIAMEIAYAALDDDEKVSLISEINDKSDKDVRQAMQMLLTGKVNDADVQLDSHGESFKALMLNIYMFKWKRALELAAKNKQWLEILMGYREKYLKNSNQKETNPEFAKFMSEVEIDWVHIRELILAEKNKGNF
uniref:WD_REPEATS_REGION domain-containing protein n=2 Tax=Caenorhabditis japonica TaxID=281687 RepID=A0A8R1DXP0_CAEJA